jgi:hypothetical protein
MINLVGKWFAEKVRRQQAELGTLKAAKNLRKQGVPIEIALLILARKS